MPTTTPPPGYTTVTPYLSIQGAAEAIAFYAKAFDAVELFRLKMTDGRIGHAELRFGNAIIMLADEYPEMGMQSPASRGGPTSSILLYMEDVDQCVAQAVAAGAKLLGPVADQFYGDRSGTVVDPFGHYWTIATHIKDVSPEEMVKAMAGQ